jgi:hypothetical protein
LRGCFPVWGPLVDASVSPCRLLEGSLPCCSGTCEVLQHTLALLLSPLSPVLQHCIAPTRSQTCCTSNWLHTSHSQARTATPGAAVPQ